MKIIIGTFVWLFAFYIYISQYWIYDNKLLQFFVGVALFFVLYAIDVFQNRNKEIQSKVGAFLLRVLRNLFFVMLSYLLAFFFLFLCFIHMINTRGCFPFK